VINSRAMLGITFGMTPICGKCAVVKLPGDAFRTMRLTRSSNFVIPLHLVVTLAHKGQLTRWLIADFIGPPSSKMRGGYVAHVRNANDQEEPFLGDNKCLNNPCYFVRYLMSGV